MRRAALLLGWPAVFPAGAGGSRMLSGQLTAQGGGRRKGRAADGPLQIVSDQIEAHPAHHDLIVRYAAAPLLGTL